MGILIKILNGIKSLFVKKAPEISFEEAEKLRIKAKGKAFLDELAKKGPTLDRVGQSFVMTKGKFKVVDEDEPLSESRKLKSTLSELREEFPKKEEQ